MKKQTKTKIEVGSVVKAKVGELENITMEGRSSMMKEDVLGCVQSVVGEKKFLERDKFFFSCVFKFERGG